MTIMIEEAVLIIPSMMMAPMRYMWFSRLMPDIQNHITQPQAIH